MVLNAESHIPNTGGRSDHAVSLPPWIMHHMQAVNKTIGQISQLWDVNVVSKNDDKR